MKFTLRCCLYAKFNSEFESNFWLVSSLVQVACERLYTPQGVEMDIQMDMECEGPMSREGTCQSLQSRALSLDVDSKQWLYLLPFILEVTFSIRLGPWRWAPTAHCAGRRGLNLLTAARPVELAQCNRTSFWKQFNELLHAQVIQFCCGHNGLAPYK